MLGPRLVVAARQRQQARFKDKPKITCNARMGSRELKSYCALDEATMELLKFAMTDLNLSARAYDRILKVARTIADLAGAENIASEHISEAIQYRSLDRRHPDRNGQMKARETVQKGAMPTGFVAFGVFDAISAPFERVISQIFDDLAWCGAVGNNLSRSQRLSDTVLTLSLRAASGWKIFNWSRRRLKWPPIVVGSFGTECHDCGMVNISPVTRSQSVHKKATSRTPASGRSVA